MLLKTAYIVFTFIIICILLFIGFKAINATFTDESKKKKKRRYLILGLVFWQVYIYIMANSGVLENYDFPPRFALFLILPAFVFTGVFAYRNRNNTWLQNIPESWLLYFQSFRIIVESIFVATVGHGLLHKEVTIEGYNFDMIYGFTVPVIAFLVFNRKVLSKKVALLWNYLGLAVIVSIIFLFMSTIYAPELYGATEPMMPLAATRYPYVLIAGFLMPAAVFVHVLSIVQLKKSKI